MSVIFSSCPSETSGPVLQNSTNIYTHSAVFLWPHPPRLQCCDWRICADVPGWHCGLHHHRLWLLGLWGRLGQESALIHWLGGKDFRLGNCHSGLVCSFLPRNTQQLQISPLLYQKTRCLGHSWWWFSFSLEPWWWTAHSTSGRLYWAKSFSRSFSCLGFTSGCSSYYPVWLRGKVSPTENQPMGQQGHERQGSQGSSEAV